MKRGRSGSRRLMQKDPREAERDRQMEEALGAVRQYKPARGPAARPRVRSVFQ